MLRYAGILLLSFASVAARAQEENPLHWAEKEQGVRAAALRERIEKVRERIRAKGLRVHALEVSPNPLANFWEDDQDTGEARVKVQKLLRLSLRGQMQELESLQRLLAEVESEREWIRAQLAGELPAAKLGNADGSMVLCGGLPVEGKGEPLRLLQDFGRRRDPETGIEWSSSGWWLSPGSERFVKACAPGKVVFSGTVPGRRRVVLLEHRSGSITVYANLREEGGPGLGALVRGGESIGEAVDRLYFEIRTKGVAVDPRVAFTQAQLASLEMTPAPTAVR